MTKITVDFINIPDAEQYRESLMLRKQIENQQKVIIAHNFYVALDKESIIIDKSKEEHGTTINLSYSNIFTNS